jgi:hypothetical protein
MTIAALKRRAARTQAVQLPADAMRDLRETLRFNARQTCATRITQDAFRTHLRETYGISVGQSTLQRMILRLGKHWSGEDVG